MNWFIFPSNVDNSGHRLQRNQSSLRTFLRKVSLISHHCQRLVEQPTSQSLFSFCQRCVHSANQNSCSLCQRCVHPANQNSLASAKSVSIQPTRTFSSAKDLSIRPTRTPLASAKGVSIQLTKTPSSVKDVSIQRTKILVTTAKVVQPIRTRM